jgi:DNA-binding transcriptional ArsR family regulator
MSNSLNTCASFLAAMANPARLQILTMLQGTEHSVGTLVQRVGLSQSALSQHLAKLREQKLVYTRKQGQMVFYRCNSARVAAILAALETIFNPPGTLVSSSLFAYRSAHRGCKKSIRRDHE